MSRATFRVVGFWAWVSFWACSAFAQPTVIRSSRLPTDHINQDMLARSLDLSAPAASASITLRGNICLDASCSGKLWRDSVNGGIRMNDTLFVDTIAANLWITNTTAGQPIYLNDGEGTRFSCVNSLPACQTGVPSGTLTTLCADYTIYWCGPTGWQTIAATGNSQLVNGDTDIGPRSVISQAADGAYAFRALHEAIWDFGPGTNDEVFSDGTIIYGSIWYISQVGANQLNPKTGNRTTYIGSDGLRIFPLGAATCATSNDTGAIWTTSSNGRLNYCDGASTSQTVGFRGGPWSASLDFSVFASNSCQTMTFTASGAVAGETVSTGGCGLVFAADTDLTCSVAISATNTAIVRICCNDTLGCVNLDPINFSASALR